MKRPQITSRKAWGLVAILIAVGITIWQLTYDSPGDRKDLRYQGWKLGIYPMDSAEALGTMTHDISPDRLVVGKTKEELIKKFGYISTIDQSSTYVRYCLFNSSYTGKQVFTLRSSNWMVLMNNGRATDLILVKGC